MQTRMISWKNPSILVSNDGSSWSVPAGLINPLIDAPPCDHNCDADIIYNSNTGEMWVYYLDTRRGTRCGGYEDQPYYNHNFLKLFKSSDGINWTGPDTLIDWDFSTDKFYLSPRSCPGRLHPFLYVDDGYQSEYLCVRIE